MTIIVIDVCLGQTMHVGILNLYFFGYETMSN